MSQQFTPTSFTQQRILVTGATGFIGSHLCARLKASGAIVHGVTRKPGTVLPMCDTTHIADVGIESDVNRLVAGIAPDYIFHLASHVSGSRALEELEPTFQSNLASVVHLLRHVSRSNCKRLVLAGSLEESADATPSSPYAAAKNAATLYARMCFNLYQTPVTIARLFMVYGPGQPDVRKLVPYVAVSLLSGRRAFLSSGVRPVDWVYIDDVVDALMACALDPGTIGKTVDVGTGQLTTVRSVAERIGKFAGSLEGPVFGAVEDRRSEQVRAADPSDATRIIGRPLTPLDEGLRRTVDWYRAKLDAGELDPTEVD